MSFGVFLMTLKDPKLAEIDRQFQISTFFVEVSIFVVVFFRELFLHGVHG
jgi:hypothetical protein